MSYLLGAANSELLSQNSAPSCTSSCLDIQLTHHFDSKISALGFYFYSQKINLSLSHFFPLWSEPLEDYVPSLFIYSFGILFLISKLILSLSLIAFLSDLIWTPQSGFQTSYFLFFLIHIFKCMWNELLIFYLTYIIHLLYWINLHVAPVGNIFVPILLFILRVVPIVQGGYASTLTPSTTMSRPICCKSDYGSRSDMILCFSELHLSLSTDLTIFIIYEEYGLLWNII